MAHCRIHHVDGRRVHLLGRPGGRPRDAYRPRCCALRYAKDTRTCWTRRQCEGCCGTAAARDGCAARRLIAIDPVTIENTAIALSSDEAARLAAFITGKPYPAASRRHACQSPTCCGRHTRRMSLSRLAVLACVLYVLRSWRRRFYLTLLDSKIEIVDFPRLYDHRCGNQFPPPGGPFVEDRVKIIAINRSASVVV